MNRLSKVIFDDFVPNGAKNTYTRVEHMTPLSGGRQLAFFIHVSQFEESFLTIILEQSNDGKNFRSKFNYSPEPGLLEPAPIVQRWLEPEDLPYLVISAAEPTQGMPNLRYSRLLITLKYLEEGRAARFRITATVRGSAEVDEDEPAPMPTVHPAGSLARHEDMMRDVSALSAASSHLAPMERAAFVAHNVKPETREHLREVERRFASMPEHVRKGMMESMTAMAKRAVELASAGAPRLAGDAAPEPEVMTAAPCGGTCGPK